MNEWETRNQWPTIFHTFPFLFFLCFSTNGRILSLFSFLNNFRRWCRCWSALAPLSITSFDLELSLSFRTFSLIEKETSNLSLLQGLSLSSLLGGSLLRGTRPPKAGRTAIRTAFLVLISLWITISQLKTKIHHPRKTMGSGCWALKLLNFPICSNRSDGRERPHDLNVFRMNQTYWRSQRQRKERKNLWKS